MAHPDDAEIGLGGTLAKMASHGWDVHVVVASVPDHREVRLAEIDAGARCLGIHAHVVDRPGTWQVEDVEVYALTRAFDHHMRELGPSRVFTHWIDDTHHDHTIVARAAVSAARDRHVDLFMSEQPNQYAPSVTGFVPDTFADVSDHFEQRLEAVRCHASQMAARDYDAHLRARAHYHGERIGCRYAEAFRCVTQRLHIW
jgi:LmbE family N-acetylglucosaminyl deacetylase